MRRLGATVEHVLLQARDRAGESTCQRVLASFPCDTRHELLLVFHALRAGARLVRCSPEERSCPLFVLDDYAWRPGGDQSQPALLWRGADECLLIFGQVRIRGAIGQIVHRLDFLVYYKRRGRPGQWLCVELDGPQHQGMPNQDEQRTESIGIPVLRYDNERTRQLNFFDRLLSDIRARAEEGASWGRDRARKARLLQEKRRREAERRRQEY